MERTGACELRCTIVGWKRSAEAEVAPRPSLRRRRERGCSWNVEACGPRCKNGSRWTQKKEAEARTGVCVLRCKSGYLGSALFWKSMMLRMLWWLPDQRPSLQCSSCCC